MAGFQGVYAGVIPEGGPPADTTQPEVREQWYARIQERFTKLCEEAYTTGDFSYVSTALQANHKWHEESV